MTQTIRRISKDKMSCDIYYHPNNSSAGLKDKHTRYKYTVHAKRLENLKTELTNYFCGKIDWEEVATNSWLQELILEIGNGAKYIVEDDCNTPRFARNMKEVVEAYKNFNC